LAELHPANFAMVMATGIVSIASRLLGYPALASTLFGVNVAAYGILIVLTVLRLVRHPQRVWSDLGHHGRAVAFFTSVAATSVLGSQCLIVASAAWAAIALWIGGVVLWAGLTYGILAILTVKESKPPLQEGLNGGWLLFVVSAQSVAVLGTQVAPELPSSEEPIRFFSLTLWLGGGMLYVWIIGLIFYRYTFFTMQPSDLAPPYWINMGAAAISTLAGALLCAAAPRDPLLLDLLPFLRGLTLLFWATATWWIPMLVMLGVWRHVLRKFPLRYDPLYWGAVFPLGMYSVCTFRVAQVVDRGFLTPVSSFFLLVAIGAWAMTAFGLLRRVASTLSSAVRRP
jgi:tellurite resistance protein TehA-like permease